MVTKEFICYTDERYKILVENLQLNDYEIVQCLLNEKFLFSQMLQQYGLNLKSKNSKECVKKHFDDTIKNNNTDLYIDVKLKQKEQEVREQMNFRYKEMAMDIVDILREYGFDIAYVE
jgi:hypothetical protein